MSSPKRSLLSAAVLLALAASPAHAVLERFGPIDHSPSVGGFPSWFQDKTGITLEFCDYKTTLERDGGWCVALEGPVPEVFPLDFGPEHFYFAADNVMQDPGLNLKARLVLSVEAGFSNEIVPIDGDQMVFGRLRIIVPNLPFDGDYRVITPYSEHNFNNMAVGDKIQYTQDIGLACVLTFECVLNGTVGPFLLPSAVPGGAEVPPMPDLKSAPPGTDPFYDAMVALGGASLDPQTGKKYIADPGRVGPVTGSPLPNFVAYDINGAQSLRNHNTFRIEVRTPFASRSSAPFYVMEGESNFVVAGRLMTGTLPGKVTPTRATYKADAVGNMTDLDVFATGHPTTQARLPAQTQQPPVIPVLSYYEEPCANSLFFDPEVGMVRLNSPQYFGPPASNPIPMKQQGTTFWGQTQPTGTPPSHVCIVDSAARNSEGQTIPAYYMQRVTDTVTIDVAGFDGPNNGTLAVNARSSDPTAKLTLVGYGPAAPETPGTATAGAPGTGLDLAPEAATVTGLMAAPATVQVTSSKGGSAVRPIETARGLPTGGGTGGGDPGGDPGGPPTIGTPVAVNETSTMFEDCDPNTASMCAAGTGISIDLIGNDTIAVNGSTMTLRNFVRQGLGTVTINAQAPRLGTANITADGVVTYMPNPNVSGTDSITYTVTANGVESNQGIFTINVTPVNDIPYAVNTSAGAVVGKPGSINLIATSLDPDGTADLKDAEILTWPAQLGPRPTPVGGVVNFTPTAAGNYNIIYQVKDAAGALSPNVAAGSVSVVTTETITFAKSQFTRGQLRWTISGNDTVRAGQEMTAVYDDGRLRAGGTCDGTATNPQCVIGTTFVDSAGGWLMDRIIPANTAQDPTNTGVWQKVPTRVRVFSSNPAMGGSNSATILLK
ncbi:MAG TPA: Ig-like domain-containing protein [Ramlibacter sp.]|uniref:Ig-like domain-containing protein n=1 Tax=Ramlibacter sp. TaxID=1917967 RepID=UPI002D8022CA|nr:Ig-like domain-containing protein [Ramlibacter sp.]HET8747017.1 Ig-like domain-containing protein [Ramlibacter sp.]